jgi:hypothetical protein
MGFLKKRGKRVKEDRWKIAELKLEQYKETPIGKVPEDWEGLRSI